MSSSAPTTTSVEPLRALRYDTSQISLEDVVAPPYDVITPAGRAELVRRSPYSFVQLELPDSPQTAAQLLHGEGLVRVDLAGLVRVAQRLADRDLRFLPPTIEEQEAFLRDSSPDAVSTSKA